MNRFKINQRHKIYQDALDELLKCQSDPILFDDSHFLCFIFNRVIHDDNIGTPPAITARELHEFMLFRPDFALGGWWNENDYDSRITCLLFCIEMTKPK